MRRRRPGPLRATSEVVAALQWRRRVQPASPETLGPGRLLLFSLPKRHGSAAVGSPDPSPVGSPVGSRTGSPASSWFFLFF